MKKPDTIHKLSMGIVAVATVILIVFLIKTFTRNSSNVVPTSEQVSQVTVGMEYNDVKKIMGCDGRKIKELGTPGASDYSIIYSWGKPGSDSMVSVEFGFNGSVVNVESNI